MLGFRKEVVLKGGQSSLDLTSLIVSKIFLPCSFLQGRGISPLFDHKYGVLEILNTLHLLQYLLILRTISNTNSHHWPQFLLYFLLICLNFFHLISREKQVPKVPISDVKIFKG